MKKILLIEDNQNIRENTAEILELANYQVFMAENGKTGIETAIKEKPDLIICDIMMPVLDGYGVLHLLHKNKQIIYQEGNRPSRLYYVQKGKVKTYKTNEDGKDLVIGLFNEGDYLGYVALLEGASYNETAEAIEDAELVIIPREDFEKLVNTSHEVMRKFITLLAHKVAEKEEKLLGLAYNSLRKK